MARTLVSPVEPANVLGVDTHKDFHVAVVLSGLGVLLDGETFPATADGYRKLVAWASGFGPVGQAGVEGTGSYGAGLTRWLRTQGVQVVEVNRPNRAMRRRRGKTDAVDAEAAARAVLAGHARVVPKLGVGPIEAIRVVKLTKDSASKARVQAINQLRNVLITAEAAVRDSLEGLSLSRLLTRCTDLEGQGQAVTLTLARLARRIRYLDQEIRDANRQLATLVQAAAPELLQLAGIGPDSAAALLIAAGDNPQRLRSEASFAALCGVCPIEASSGKTRRHRLNRGGNRQANAALFRAVLSRLRWDPTTQEYVQRRITDGLSKREAIRCLKRYLARTVYKILIRHNPEPTTTWLP
ncbi:IS110 family transposase [Streptomyces sp. NPDC051940]|uniref:IS110 family transposase n=1 Tax=Streptomyces sp. NPDC051940 TaxID=3155675 RepID=UPI0034150099